MALVDLGSSAAAAGEKQCALSALPQCNPPPVMMTETNSTTLMCTKWVQTAAISAPQVIRSISCVSFGVS